MTELTTPYRGIICDLDGVVYRGALPVPYAVDALTASQNSGRWVVYATNNASRPPAEVVRQLSGFGLTLEQHDVVTSSQAGAAHLKDHLPPGAPVLAVGGLGVYLALEEAGLTVVSPADAPRTEVSAVLQGLGQDLTWRDLAEAAYAVNGGALWVATNTDMTLPTDRGEAPGNGALVAVVRAAVDHDPVVVGKPFTPLYDLSVKVLGTTPATTLAVGDRLDTDIEGAGRAGIESLWVSTGVSGVLEVALARGYRRPTFLAADLRALHAEYLPAQVEGDGSTGVAECGTARVSYDHRGLSLSATASAHEHRMRALVAAVWAAVDADHEAFDSAALAAAGHWVEAGEQA